MRKFLSALVAGILVLSTSISLGNAGVHNCKPAWKCQSPSPSVIITPQPTIVPTPIITPTPTIVPTPRPTVTPTVAPTPTPPSTNRPFPVPVTTGTFNVPTSIDRTGATDVSTALNNYIASVPNGSIIVFPAGSTYKLNRGLGIEARQNLIFRGSNVQLNLRSPGGDSINGPAFLVRNSTHIEISDFIVVGNNPDTTNIFVPGNEGQHVLSLNGWFNSPPSSFIEMKNITGSHIYGDAAYLEGQNTPGVNAPSHHVWIHHNNFTYMGRMGVASINVNDVLIENNFFDKIGGAPWDIEPNFAWEQVRRNTFRNNTVGSYGHSRQFAGFFVVAAWIESTPVEALRVENNTVSGNPAQGYDGTPRGLHSKFVGKYTTGAGIRLKDVIFTGNTTTRTVSATFGSGGVFYFKSVDTAVITGNIQPITSGSTLARFDDCTGITFIP